MEGIDAAYISKCLYHPEKAPLCPIFKLGDIVKLSGFSFETIAREVSRQLWIPTTRCDRRERFSGRQADFQSHQSAPALATFFFLVFCSFCFAVFL